MKILVADDHPLYREAVAIQISRIFADTQVVEVASIDELYVALRESAVPFDLFLIDYKMPGMSVGAVSDLARDVPGTPIAIISGSAQPVEIKATIEAGARGYIPKTATGERLAHALELILAGGTSVPTELLFDVGPANEASGWVALLSQREREVLRGVGRGLSNKEIGRELDLAEVTIKLHLRSVFRKMGARSRADAAVMASKAGLV